MASSRSPRNPRNPPVPPPAPEEEDVEFTDQLVVDVAPPSGYSFHRTETSSLDHSAADSPLREYVVKPIDDDFCSRHLSHRPFDAQNREEEISAIVKKLGKVTKIGAKLYAELAKLLTVISKEVYRKCLPVCVSALLTSNPNPSDTLSDGEKKDLEGRLQALGPLWFIQNCTKAPSEHPLPDINDEPDLVAVVEPSRFSDDKGASDPIPHRYIETLVEVKADDSNALLVAATYAYRHQRDRPDQPAFLCLIAKPHYYQLLLSDPSGVTPSPRFPWTSLTSLASFMYTIYVPPHPPFLHDDTLRWVHHEDGTTRWNIVAGGQEYTDCQCVILGDAWGRQSTIYYAVDGKSRAIIKDYYHNPKRQFDEADILSHIHADGDVPGVVRLKSAQDVRAGDAVITCGSKEASDRRTRRRLVLYDVGLETSKATSINDILKMLYDALQGTLSNDIIFCKPSYWCLTVHRTLVWKRGILHRDMSVHNILMTPKRRKLDRPIMKDRPLFIDEMLKGRRYVVALQGVS